MKRNMILKCLEIAFDAKYNVAKLSDPELAALIGLQYALWWQRDIVAYLLSDYSDRSEELEQKCRRAMERGSLGRNSAIIALAAMPTHFPRFKNKVEKLFMAYIDEALSKDALSEAEGAAFVGAYSQLRHFRLSFDNPNYEFTTGKEQAQAIIDDWISAFDGQDGWQGLCIADALRRIELLQNFNVRNSLYVDWKQSDAIFWHYLQNIDGYANKDYCKAVALRGSDMDRAEEPYAEEDLNKAYAVLLSTPDLETRLIAARSIVEIFHTLCLEEAAAMAALPESSRKEYLKVVQAKKATVMTDSELIKSSELAYSAITTLYMLEDDCGFFVENLKIAQSARHLCNELMSRAGQNMLPLAQEIGFADKQIGSLTPNWAISRI